MIIDNCYVEVLEGELLEDEAARYVARGREKYGDRLKGIKAKVDGEFIELSYDIGRVPFQRIRRITGYLVGGMERWNDAKSAEEADRIKHHI